MFHKKDKANKVKYQKKNMLYNIFKATLKIIYISARAKYSLNNIAELAYKAYLGFKSIILFLASA